MWSYEIESIIYHLEPLASLSVDTLGPLPEDKNGFSFIVVMVDNLSLSDFIQRGARRQKILSVLFTNKYI